VQIKITSQLINEKAPHAGRHTVVAANDDKTGRHAFYRGKYAPAVGTPLVLIGAMWEERRS
jgi:hypothetical protein